MTASPVGKNHAGRRVRTEVSVEGGAAVEGVLGVVTVRGPVPGADRRRGRLRGGRRRPGGGRRRAAPSGQRGGAEGDDAQRPPESAVAGPRRRARRPTPGAQRPQPKPAVAGASDEGPLAGAGFSEGPDNGALILPRRVGTPRPRRDAHGHAGREVEAARHGHGRRGLAVGEGHPHDPSPVARRPAAGERPAAGDVDVDEVEGSVGGEGQAERVVLVGALPEVGHRRAGNRAPSRLGLTAGVHPDDGGVPDVAADGVAAARRVPCDAGGEGDLVERRHLHLVARVHAAGTLGGTGREGPVREAEHARGADVGDEQVAVGRQRHGPRLGQPAGAVRVMRPHSAGIGSVHDAVGRVVGCEPLHQPPAAGGRVGALCRGDVVGEDVVPSVDRAPGVGLVVVEHPVRARRRIAPDRLAGQLVRARHVEGLAAEGPVGLVELLTVGGLFVRLEPAEAVLARERRVVATDEAAVGQHADLSVEVPGGEELTQGALGHRQEVDLLVLVPVDEVPGLTLHTGRRRRDTAPRRRRRRRRARPRPIPTTPGRPPARSGTLRTPHERRRAAPPKPHSPRSPSATPIAHPDAGVIVGEWTVRRAPDDGITARAHRPGGA